MFVKPLPIDLLSPVNVPLIFSSGMSRGPDFKPALAVNHAIGVDIQEMSANASDALAAAMIGSEAHVFVDSGAFAYHTACERAIEKRKPLPKPVDFDKVFERYEYLSLAVCKADDGGDDAASRLHFVLPDVVGDQEASLALLHKYVDKIEGGYGLWSILPVQSGAMSLIEYYDRACVILNVTGGMIIGIPSNAKAASDDELRELLVARPDIYGVHILGAAGGLRGKARLAVLRSVGYDGEVSLDANRVSTWWNKWCPNRSEARARLLAGLPPKTRLTEGEPWPMAA